MAEPIEEDDLAFVINQEIRREEGTLIQAKDWPDFKERTGRIKGLKKTLEIQNNLVKHLREYDEDDDDDD